VEKFIKIKGARTHNLKNIDLELPKNNLITITGTVRGQENHL
jgi:excinuclease ABC subunit A